MVLSYYYPDHDAKSRTHISPFLYQYNLCGQPIVLLWCRCHMDKVPSWCAKIPPILQSILFWWFSTIFICLIDLKLVIIDITMKFCMLQASHRTAYLNSWTNFAPKQKQTKGEYIEIGGQVRSWWGNRRGRVRSGSG